MTERTRRRALVAVAAVAGCGAALATGAALGTALLDDGGSERAAGREAASGRLIADRRSGVSLRLPPGWRRLRTRPGGPDLLAQGPDGRALLVRTMPLPGAVARDGDAFAEYVRRRLEAVDGVRVLGAPRRVRVAGLRGHAYVTTFTDVPTGRRGAHSHIVLRDRDRAVELVMQALPAERFGAAAATFDRITASLRVRR